MPESYREVEERIEDALEAIETREKPNISAIAREFEVLYQRLRARSMGILSHFKRRSVNKLLTEV